MELSFARCETIMKTLPIGYYAGRRIECALDEKEGTSFYSPMEDKIVISYPIIAHRLGQIKNTVNEEEAVRAMLYHEVSHAIMTNANELYPSKMNNIFEDERIETVLKDYYLKTDFKKQLVEIHNGIPMATDADSAFFNAVRFRKAPDNILADIDNIIKKYGHLIRVGDDYDWFLYRHAIKDLYDKISRAFSKTPNEFQPSSGEQGDTEKALDSIKQKMGQGKSSEKGKNKSGQTSSQNGIDENSGEEGEGEGQSEGKDSDSESTKTYCDTESDMPSKDREKLQKMFGGALSKNAGLSEGKIQQLNDFTKTAEMIISNFNKKNSGGSGICAYSGVFNPRSVARQDYRFFDRSMTTNGNNKFGTCHLNLFIDCSGSMNSNEEIVNGMLQSLTAIERKNKNFSMDVVFLDHRYHECETVRDRQFRANGSNDIPKDMKEKFLSHQKANTCNYNIVLFDGDVYCMENRGREEEIRRFSAFDYKQTTVIIDPSNEPYLGSGFKSAKVVLTHDYANELLKHITKALTVAFG